MIKEEIIAIIGLFVNVWHYLFARVDIPIIFSGYSSYYFAKKFADKRTRRYMGYDQDGKEHGVFPVEDSLIVLNKIELRKIKKRYKLNSWIALKMNPRKYIKRNSYYKTNYE